MYVIHPITLQFLLFNFYFLLFNFYFLNYLRAGTKKIRSPVETGDL